MLFWIPCRRQWCPTHKGLRDGWQCRIGEIRCDLSVTVLCLGRGRLDQAQRVTAIGNCFCRERVEVAFDPENNNPIQADPILETKKSPTVLYRSSARCSPGRVGGGDEGGGDGGGGDGGCGGGE